MADFLLAFLPSSEPRPAAEEDSAPTFFDFLREEFDLKLDTNPIAGSADQDIVETHPTVVTETEEVEERSFRHFVAELLVQRSVVSAFQVLTTTPPPEEPQQKDEDVAELPSGEVDAVAVAESAEAVEVPASPATETGAVPALPSSEVRVVALPGVSESSAPAPRAAPASPTENTQRSRQFPKLRLPRASEIVRKSRQQETPQTVKPPPPLPTPSLRSIGKFREKSALQILQTLAEKEEEKQSDLSSEDRPVKPTLRIEKSASLKIAAEVVVQPVPPAELAREPTPPVAVERTLGTVRTSRVEMVRKERKLGVFQGVGEFDLPRKTAPSLRREMFRAIRVDGRTVRLTMENSERTECGTYEAVTVGRALGLDLPHEGDTHQKPNKPCNCPIHRHRIRIVA